MRACTLVLLCGVTHTCTLSRAALTAALFRKALPQLLTDVAEKNAARVNVNVGTLSEWTSVPDRKGSVAVF